MSLTSHLKNKNSPIKQFFEENFNRIDLFLTKENAQLKKISTILPGNEQNYPWSKIGHITEYLLAIHMGLPLENLFPMTYLKQLNNKEYEEIKSKNINKRHLEGKEFDDIVSKTLYHL